MDQHGRRAIVMALPMVIQLVSADQLMAASRRDHPLTKKIHASRSAAADLGHALACGYARGSGTGLAVAGPGSLPGPQCGSDAGRFGRDVISGVRAC